MCTHKTAKSIVLYYKQNDSNIVTCVIIRHISLINVDFENCSRWYLTQRFVAGHYADWEIWSGWPGIDVLIERLLYPEVSDNSKETAIRGNIGEHGHINSQGLWQHTQGLHKPKSDMTSIWKRGSGYKVPHLTKKCNRTMPNHDQKQNSTKTMVIWTGEISWDLSPLQRTTVE